MRLEHEVEISRCCQLSSALGTLSGLLVFFWKLILPETLLTALAVDKGVGEIFDVA